MTRLESQSKMGDADGEVPDSVARTVGELLALGTAVLPILGFVVRLVAFLATPRFHNQAMLAWSASIPSLALTGIAAIVVPLIFIFIFSRVVRVTRREVKARKSPSLGGGVFSLLGLSIVLVLCAVGAVWLILFWPWPGVVVNFGSVIAAQLMIERRRTRIRRRLRFGDLWPVMLVVFLIASVGAGFNGAIVGVTTWNIRFATDTNVRSGLYQEIAAADGVAYFRACTPQSGDVIGVASDQIVRESPAAPIDVVLRPSLLGILFDRESVEAGLAEC